MELLDDYMELHANRGYMARIVAPANEAERTLVVEFAESGEGSFFEFAAAFGFDPSDVAARHTRLRRWDQLDGTGSDGLLDVVTEAVHLEDGIRVQFSGDDLSPGPPTFNRGDYWVFAARAATGEVDELVDAPPRGIHRHHCRLALVEWGVDGPIVIEDCRNHWPPAVQVAAGQGCCTVIVEPDAGLTIQEAIESLPEDGGCVCIRAGVHRITAPITIDRSNVVLQGESPGATIVRNGFPLIVVGSLETETSNVRVLGLELVAEAGAIDISDFIGDEMTVPPHLETSATSAWEWALVRLDRCRNLALTDCVLRCTADRNMLLGILALGANDLRVHNNTFSSILAGVWVLHHAEAVSSKLTVTNNRMSAGDNLTDLIGGLVGILLAGEEVHVSGNSIAHFGIGVQVNMSGRGGARVLDNGISDALGAGISIQRGMRLEPEPKHRSVIRGNAIYSRSEGVRLAGIWINSLPGMDAKENQIDGCVFGMLLQDTDYAVVSGNRIRDALFVGISLSQGTHNRVRHNHFAGGNGAVLANGEASLEVTDNGIENMSAGGVLGLALRESMIVSRNRLTGCGYQGMELDTGDRAAFGIALDASATPRVQIVVESCQILNTGVAMDVSAVADCPAFGIWVSGAESCRVQGNQVRSESDERPAHTGDRALWLAGISDGEIGIDSPIASALVLDNRFVGGGGSPHLVEFSIWDEEQRVARTFDRITFNNNLCEHRGAEPDQNPATIVFSAPAGTGLIPRPPRVIAMGNQIRVTSSRAGFIACAFDFGSLANVVLLGNVADGRICNLGEGNIPTSYPGFNDVPFP